MFFLNFLHFEVVIPVAITIIIFVASWIFQPALSYYHLLNQIRPTLTLTVKVEKSKSRSRKNNIIELETVEVPNPTITPYDIEYDLSIVIPAYNESERLPPMLKATFDFLESWDGKVTYEIIVVDDGSTDGTSDLIRNVMKQRMAGEIKLVQVGRNQGKGASVRTGVQLARGSCVLMADADGATEFSALGDLYKLVKSRASPSSRRKKEKEHEETSYDIAIGSRAHMAVNSVKSRALHRTILMYGFHCLVYIFCTRHICDTQCGFKLFRRAAAQRIFSGLHLERWAFDIELIYLAEALNFTIVEVPVEWTEIAGSKLIRSSIDIVTTSLSMARDIICVRLCYVLGIWTLRS